MAAIPFTAVISAVGLLLLSCANRTSADQPAPKTAETAASPREISPSAAKPTEKTAFPSVFRGDPAHSGRSPYKGPRAADPKWAFRTQGRIYADAAIAQDGTIYIASLDGFLYAVSPDGKEKWSFNAGGKIWTTPALAADGTIYFGSDADKIYALTPHGKVKWTLSTEMPPEKKGQKVPAGQWDVDTSPVVGPDGTVYFACHYYLYAVRPSGELRWRFQAGVGRVKIFSSPALGPDGTLYFGTQGKRLFAVNGAGAAVWNVETGGDNDAAPAVSGDTVYFGSDDGKVRALSTADGTARWEADLGAPIRAPIAVGPDGTVFAATYGARPFVVALDKDKGTERFRFFTEAGDGAFYGIQSGILVDKEGYLYFGGRDHYIYCLTPDGELKWRYETGDQVDSGPVLDKNGTLYVGSDDRRLTAFE